MLFDSIKSNLDELIQLLGSLNDESLSQSRTILSGASIGGHYRHIIEMYLCLLKNYEFGLIDYDDRSRDNEIETKVSSAVDKLIFIKDQLIRENKVLFLKQIENGISFNIETNYYRELLYNLEHSIHHQALIKIGLSDCESITFDKNFGVAKSTIEYREQCAQ